MQFPFGETVYRLAYLGDDTEDAHGNPVDSWATEPGAAVPGCAFDPGTSKEPFEANRNAVSVTPQLFCPPGAVFSARDRVKVRGLVYEVAGEPGDWVNPFTGWNPGIVLNLERVSG